jgi:mannose-1-phosphate guanylyltransferase
MKVVIFAGGYGTRMWPASRKSHPKQFFPVVKGQSFFRVTVDRFKKKFDPKDIFVSTEEKYVHFIHEQAPEIPEENIIPETERRDLLGAVGLVSAVIEKRFPGEVMFFSWSDHFISDEEEFLKAVIAASEHTQKTGIPVSINERPTFPSIHNGWLEMGDVKGKSDNYDLYQIKRFIEKPDEKTAREFMDSGNYLIHTGYAAWRSDLMLGYFKEFRPNEYAGLTKITEAMGTDNYDQVLREEYSKFEKVSIEYGLYEKLPSDLRLTIAVASGWEDAGTWQLFYKAMLESNSDSVYEGDIKVQNIDSSRNLVIGSGKKMIALIGVSDLVIVDTGNVLLVSSMNETNKVKDMFKKLEEEDQEFVD